MNCRAQAGSDNRRAFARQTWTMAPKVFGTKIYITYGPEARHDGNIIHRCWPTPFLARRGVRATSSSQFHGQRRRQPGRAHACVSIEHKLGVKASPPCCSSATMAARRATWSAKESRDTEYMVLS
jgi:hypothetical protein